MTEPVLCSRCGSRDPNEMLIYAEAWCNLGTGRQADHDIDYDEDATVACGRCEHQDSLQRFRRAARTARERAISVDLADIAAGTAQAIAAAAFAEYNEDTRGVFMFVAPASQVAIERALARLGVAFQRHHCTEPGDG